MAPFTRAASCGSRKISYREDYTTSDLEDEDLKNDEVASEKIPSSSSANKCSQTNRSSPRRKKLSSSAEKRKASISGCSTSVNKANWLVEQKEGHENEDPVLRLGGNIPQWQNLPYHILFPIFRSLAYPPYKPAWRAWLAQTALLCKSFAEPALSALYYKLDFTSIKRGLQLCDLLRFQTTDSYLNYRVKVKWLVFGVPPGKSRSPCNLDVIIALTPQLRGIEIVSLRSGIETGWYQLLESLKAHHVRLREWVWDDCTSAYSKRVVDFVYPTASLQTLERIEINHVGYLTWETQEFAAAINDLPRLKHLAVNLASLFNPELLLSLLSVKLESLELANCAVLSPDIIALFLTAWGQELRLLNLDDIDPRNHSVTGDLARSCPQLQDLRMRYAPSRYELSSAGLEGLGLDKKFTWPSSLWCLKLLRWGGWPLASADVFFSSLVDSAASLPNLRHIHIRASLGESAWMARVRFRDKWTKRFSRVFLRTSKPPSPYLQSLGAHQAFKMAQKKATSKPIAYGSHSHPATRGPNSIAPCETGDPLSNVGSEKGRSGMNQKPDFDKSSQVVGHRRSHRLRQHTGNSQHTANSQRFPKNLSPPIRHRRRRRRRAQGSGSDSSSEDSALEDEVEGKDFGGDASQTDEENFHIQGLCDVVDIQFGNLRPSERQLRESDFLDKEISGDEDWNGPESS